MRVAVIVEKGCKTRLAPARVHHDILPRCSTQIMRYAACGCMRVNSDTIVHRVWCWSDVMPGMMNTWSEISLDAEPRLQGFAPILTQEHQWGHALMFGDGFCQAINIPIHPRGVRWDSGLGYVCRKVKLFHGGLHRGIKFTDLSWRTCKLNEIFLPDVLDSVSLAVLLTWQLFIYCRC